jgi:hypothetical protein
MRGRRADVDADGAQPQPLGRDISAQVIRIVAVMTMMSAVVRKRRSQ